MATAKDRSLIEKGAHSRGLTLSTFMLTAAREATDRAGEIAKAHALADYRARQADRFLALAKDAVRMAEGAQKNMERMTEAKDETIATMKERYGKAWAEIRRLQAEVRREQAMVRLLAGKKVKEKRNGGDQ